MNVVLINTVCDFASTGRIATELSHAITNKGHSCYIAYSISTRKYENSYQIGSQMSKKLHALFSRIFGLQAYFSRLSTWRFLRYLKKVKPDIVHLGNLHSNFIHLGMLLQYLAKKDVATVITLHDCWFFTGKCPHYVSQKCMKWKTGCRDCPRVRLDNKSYFFDRTQKMWKDKKKWFLKIPRLAVVGVSEWITKEAKQSFLKSGRIERIYNWVDLKIFYPRVTTMLRKRLNLEQKYIVLGVAGGWSDTKGLEAFLELSKMLPDSYRIVLVGNMPKTVDLPRNIIAVPHVDLMSELAEYYSLADVFVNTSMEESFGKVTAESLACGTPAIVYDITACPEIVGKNCGYVVPFGDLEAVKEKVLLTCKNGKQVYAQRCIEYVKKNFSYEDNTNAYIELYETLIKEKV